MRTKTELYREAKRRVESRRQQAVTEAVARRARWQPFPVWNPPSSRSACWG